MTQPATFELTLGEWGNPATIVVNGQDISNSVMAVAVDSAVGQPTTLHLTMRPTSGPVTGTGIVELVSLLSPANAVKRLNTAEVEKLSLDRMSWGDDRSLAEIMMATIVEMLHEAEPIRP